MRLLNGDRVLLRSGGKISLGQCDVWIVPHGSIARDRLVERRPRVLELTENAQRYCTLGYEHREGAGRAARSAAIAWRSAPLNTLAASDEGFADGVTVQELFVPPGSRRLGRAVSDPAR